MIVSCGEALVDLIPAECAGQPGLVPRPGGSPLNVAVALGRLGVPAGFLGGVSRDALGRMLLDHLDANGVDGSLAPRSDAPTPLAVVSLDAEGRAEYAFHLAETAMGALGAVPGPLPAAVRGLHVGSIALAIEPLASVVEELLLREGPRRLTSLDPNVRGRFITDRSAYLRRLGRLLAATDVAKVSDEDLAWLHPGARPGEIAAEWVAEGPALVVVTRGAEGASAVTADRTVDVPGLPVEVVDTVGAGDAFTAGLLARLGDLGHLHRDGLDALSDQEVTAALRHAVRVAARTCERTGADPPTADELSP